MQLPLNVISTQNGCNYFAVTSALNIYIKTMEQGMKVQGRPARDGHIYALAELHTVLMGPATNEMHFHLLYNDKL